MKYFKVLFHEFEDLGTGRARSSELEFLPDGGQVGNWTPPELDLVDGMFPDYLANDLGYRLCSQKMREVLSASKTDRDELQWLPASVFCGGEARSYWALHFTTPADVLSSKTVRHGDMVVKPVFSRAKLNGHAVLTYPGSEGVGWLVDERARAALELAGCTGFEFGLAPLDR